MELRLDELRLHIRYASASCEPSEAAVATCASHNSNNALRKDPSAPTARSVGGIVPADEMENSVTTGISSFEDCKDKVPAPRKDCVQRSPANSYAPGTVYYFDFRENGGNCTSLEQEPAPTELRCVQWNIERGYKLDAIIKMLAEHDADIICLQELDIGCERSGSRNCAAEIASALKLKCAFLVEFEEIFSDLRSKETQGGGVHGNAILSKFDFSCRILSHSHHPINWEVDGHRLAEPRTGERAALVADISVPGLDTPLVCYCLHLEVFCGILGRLKQFSDVLEDSHEKRCQQGCVYQLIMGDLNTMAHGIARLSPNYCRDFLRWWSLGQSEGSWWHRYVLQVQHDEMDSCNHKLLPLHPRYFSMRELKALRNSFFLDPFHVDSDVTLSNYRGAYTGKLDWCLFRGFEFKSCGMDNLDYSASDHRLLAVTVTPARSQGGVDPGEFAYLKHFAEADTSEEHLRIISRSSRAYNAIFVFFGFVLTSIVAKDILDKSFY